MPVAAGTVRNSNIAVPALLFIFYHFFQISLTILVFLFHYCSCLVVLEHSCFACIENETHLIEMEISQGVPPMIARMGVAQWLVQQVQAISRQAFIAGLKKVRIRFILLPFLCVFMENEK